MEQKGFKALDQTLPPDLWEQWANPPLDLAVPAVIAISVIALDYEPR